VTWPDHAEVPPVERRNLSEPEALGDRDHGGIDDAERKVLVPLDKLSHARDVTVLKLRYVEAVIAERPEERDFRLRTHARLK
jgi:hypothetical protein